MTKILKTLRGCQTIDQFEVALRYLELMIISRDMGLSPIEREMVNIHLPEFMHI